MSKRSYTEPSRKGCKFCGSKTVAWDYSRESTKSTNGKTKWFLTEIFEDAEGRTYTEHSLLHSQFCKKPGLHDLEQSSRLAEENEDKGISRERTERNAREEAQYFLELHAFCKNQREQAMDDLGQRERDLERFSDDDSTTDQEYKRFARLTTEIAFMQAALGLTKYEDEDDFPVDCEGKPLAWPDPNTPGWYVDAWNGIYDSREFALAESRHWIATEDERTLSFGSAAI